jgi:hypothetical protein
LLQAESEHDGPAEQEEQTPASAKNKFENKVFRGTKYPRYQPETASAVLMKYLVGSDKERQAEPLDSIHTLFKNIAATVKMSSNYHQNICKSRLFANVSEVEMTEILQETTSMHSSEYSFGSPYEPDCRLSGKCLVFLFQHPN